MNTTTGSSSTIFEVDDSSSVYSDYQPSQSITLPAEQAGGLSSSTTQQHISSSQQQQPPQTPPSRPPPQQQTPASASSERTVTQDQYASYWASLGILEYDPAIHGGPVRPRSTTTSFELPSPQQTPQSSSSSPPLPAVIPPPPSQQQPYTLLPHVPIPPQQPPTSSPQTPTGYPLLSQWSSTTEDSVEGGGRLKKLQKKLIGGSKKLGSKVKSLGKKMVGRK